MSVVFKGSPGPVIIREEMEYSPDTGRRVIIEYRGRKLEILGLIPEFEQNGTSFRFFKADDVYYGIIATWQDVNVANTQDIRWSLTTETLQRSIFSFPQIQAEISAYSNPPALKEAITRAATSGSGIIKDDFSSSTTTKNPVTFSSASYPNAHIALEELIRGVDHYDDEYMVVRREAIKSARYPFTRMRTELDVTKKIYGTGDLGLPSTIAFQIPSLDDLIQAAPANTYWGWRLRVAQSEYEGETLRQTHEFVLANWSTNLYTRATNAFVYVT